MRYSKLFGKTARDFPKEEVSINAKLLIKAGFIDKLMAGSFTLLPLGFRVKEKIEQIVREEMDATGANEMLMPLLHPKEIWNETGRWDSAKEVMYQFKKDNKEYALSFTHEEIVLDILRKKISGYKDLPVKVYHFSTKFRDEPRAKSGILRGREFLMKDLYSAHATAEDLDKYYWEVAKAYLRIFKKFGLDAKIVEAAGGVFTDSHTHEFQVLCDRGEDTIFYCDCGSSCDCQFAENKEITTVKAGDKCPKCDDCKIKEGKSIEVGNIFKFGTVYSQKMGVYYTDKDGTRKLVHFASYGIGITRMIGTLVELFHDDKGIIWPKSVAPYQTHLIEIGKDANQIYEKLQKERIEVLYDDRDVSAGQKFADADLIGIPVRLVVGAKNKDKIEWKERTSDKTELLGFEGVLKRLKKDQAASPIK
ncbi:MAG: aminoacyl--tRNA ligase-related protein [Candidatus Levyibacteriota bacterium]|jgi:prolyl-tRNA synthetase